MKVVKRTVDRNFKTTHLGRKFTFRYTYTLLQGRYGVGLDSGSLYTDLFKLLSVG